jgi:hypothetical protein
MSLVKNELLWEWLFGHFGEIENSIPYFVLKLAQKS